MDGTIIALLLRILSNPVANTFQKKLSKNYSSLIVNFYSYFLMCILCIIPAVSINWAKFGINFWIYSAIAGLLCTTGTICLIKALSIGELSILGPINSYKCIVGLIIAMVWLGEIPSLKSLFGVIFIIIGSRIIFETTKEGFSLQLLNHKDIQLRLWALFLTGTEAVFLKKVILLSSPLVSFLLWAFWGCLFSGVFLIFSNKKFKKIKLAEAKDFVFITLCLSIMQITTNIVFKKIDVGLSLALFQLSSIVSLFFGYKIFHEHDIKKKLCGTIIMVLGACTILL
jgi:drug/metabolite transporter (DMT)-like permease